MILSKLADGVRQRFPANDGREVAIFFTMSGYSIYFVRKAKKGSQPIVRRTYIAASSYKGLDLEQCVVRRED